MRTSARDWLLDRAWIWSFVLVLILWLLILALSHGRGGTTILTAALQFATFYVIVGIGQMLVIAAGPGNIDLSIPGVMPLAGYYAMGAMNGSDAGLVSGLAIGAGIGLAAGAANFLIIRLLAIPPIIATLATGFVTQSIAIAYSGSTAAKPAPLLSSLVTQRVFGIPVLAIVFVVVVVLVAQMLLRTTFGRSVLAMGQNARAARLAGLNVSFTLCSVYLLSGLLAGLAGVLLAAFSGGASMEMGADFTLTSVAVVVLGGTAITGGQAAPVGLWGAAILLQLLATMLNVLGVADGPRYALTGLIIIAVLTVTTRR
jgi:ribose transport system permease protein